MAWQRRPLPAAILLLLAQLAAAVFSGSRSAHHAQLFAGNCAMHKSGDSMSTLYQVEWRNGKAVEVWQKIVEQERHSWTSHELAQAQGSGKLALVFMVGSEFPLQEVWRSWFRTADASRYKLVIHSSERDEYLQKVPPEFRDAVMDQSVPSQWCGMVPSVLAAARVALADPAVQKIVYLCGSTVPLKSFDYMYNALLPPQQTGGGGRRGSLPLSEMCTDEDWHRGMPWSYVLSRADATLFAKAEDPLTALFNGVSTCDIEDWFVIAFELVRRPYSTSCVTWNGWTEYKGFSQRTNGAHYSSITGNDPGLSFHKLFGRRDWEDIIRNGSSGATYLPSDCLHPITIVDLPRKVMENMTNDPDFLFARKFNASGSIGGVPLEQYFAELFAPPRPGAPLDEHREVKVVPHDYQYLWHLWLRKLQEDRERPSPMIYFFLGGSLIVLVIGLAAFYWRSLVVKCVSTPCSV